MTPPGNAKDVVIYPHATLTWSLEEEGLTADSYSLYLGEGSLPNTASYANLTETSQNIPFSDLKFDTLYRWKVVAKVGEEDHVSETLSFTTSSAVAITNSFTNGSYLWFDVILQDSSNATIDFLAVKTGESASDKATTTAMNDTDGRAPLDGMHFRDTFKKGEVHRVILYNLDFETSYDVYAYFRDDGGLYSQAEGSPLLNLRTAKETTDLGIVDYVAYPGQKLLIPTPNTEQLRTPLVAPNELNLYFQYPEQDRWYQLYAFFASGSWTFGIDYDSAKHDEISAFQDAADMWFIKETGNKLTDVKYLIDVATQGPIGSGGTVVGPLTNMIQLDVRDSLE